MVAIKIAADTHLKQARAEFAALTAQVEALNAAMRRTAMVPHGGSSQGYSQVARGLAAANHEWAKNVASSGQYRVEQLKVNDAVEQHTKLLQKQKLGFREAFGKKNQRLMRAVYREQLAMQQAAARMPIGGISDGKMRATLAVPTEVHKSWDTLNNKVGFFGERLRSASTELVNWGKNTQWAGRQLMAGITMPVAAFGAVAGVLAYQVDKEFTRIAKVYNTTANANSKSIESQIAVEQELKELREAGAATAIKAAHDYGMAMKDTLEVQAELAATGQTGVKLQENTAEVMRISMLGEIDHMTTTKALIGMQATLKASVAETTAAFNYMNAVENSTSLATADFAAAIPIALAPMKQMSAEGSTSIEVMQNLSTLMVGMRERGIEAGEGANAIKAMMQRLYRPSKQIREEWTAIAGIDPADIVKNTGGDIMQMLPQIQDAIKDLARPDQTKLLAGLFGTYQVTRMRAMLEGVEDYNKGVGQTGQLLKLNGQSWEDWADIAEREQKRAAESVSGQFKRALEGVKAELSIIGEDFLAIGTFFLKGVAHIAEFFNSLPGWVKKGALLVAILAAMAGPAIMLVGLFANLAGNVGKMVAWGIRAASSFEMLNKSQWLARASAAMAKDAFQTETSAAQMLTQQMQALNEAFRQHAIVASRVGGFALPASFVQTTPGNPKGFIGPHNQPTGVPISISGLNPRLEPKPGGMYNGAKMPGESPGDLANRQAAADRLAATERKRLHNQMLIGQQANAELAIRDKTQRAVNGAAVGSAAMAASMALMVLPMGETANSAGQMLMLMTIAGPAVTLVGKALASAAKSAKAVAAAQLLSVRTAKANAVATGAIAGRMGAAKAAASGFKAGMLSLMGPIGWTATAVAGIGYALYKVHKASEESIKRQIEQQKALNKTTEEWADILSVAKRDKKELALTQFAGEQGGPGLREQADMYAGSDSGKKVIEAYEDGSEAEKSTLALQQYLQILRETDATAAEARHGLEVFYTAVGYGALEAASAADALAQSIGSMGTEDMAALWSKQMQNVTDGIYQEAKPAGEEIGKVLADAIMTGGKKNRDQTVDTFVGSIQEGWGKVINEMSSPVQELLGNLDVDQTNIRGFIADYKKVFDGEMSRDDWISSLGMNSSDQKKNWGAISEMMSEFDFMVKGSGGNADRLRQAEEGVVKTLSDQLMIGKELNTISELRETWEWKLFTVTRKTGEALLAQRIAQIEAAGNSINPFIDAQYKMSDAQKLVILNQIRVNAGLDAATSLSEGMKDNTKATAANLMTATGQARELAGVLASAYSFSDDNMKSILESGMTGAIDDLAGLGSEIFDNSMNAQIDAAQDGWDDRIDALDDSIERQNERFENKWERRTNAVEKSYDRRIKAIDKTIEAEQKAEDIRQRIFEAEQTRLERLADSANMTIDFNMALQTGELDEAAKIRNDMEAQAQEWALGDAAARGSRQSENRTDRMEKSKDILEKEKDHALKMLKKREDAERKHLDKIQEMRKESLQDQQENSMEYLRRDLDNQKAARDAQLELLKSIPVANKKQLDAALKAAGLTIQDFGFNSADKFGNFFEKSFNVHVRTAGNEIAQDNMWENLGANSAKRVLLGMGFGSMAKFKKFIQTGELPDDFGKVKPKNNKPAATAPGGREPDGIMHGGGIVGKAQSSRKGVARTMKGMAPGERMILAQDDEFIVNKEATARHGDLLDAINTGRLSSVRNKGYGVGGSPAGIAGIVSAAMNVGLAQGVGMAFNKSQGGIMPGQEDAGGLFTDIIRGMGGWQRASVPGKGWSNSHDYRNGIGSPLYAVNDGRIIESRAITSGGSPGNGLYPTPYRSYGETVLLQLADGTKVRYAHLSPGQRAGVGPVKGGDLIGRSGNTGNSSGPHTHFDINGAEIAREWFAAHGVGLAKGGYTKKDGIANLHKNETVIDPKRTKMLFKGIESLYGATSHINKLQKRGIGTIGDEWKYDNTRVDPDVDGIGWTWMSGIAQAAVAAKSSKNPIGDNPATGGMGVRTGTYNLYRKTSNAQSQADLERLMGMADVLSLTEFIGHKRGLQDWIKEKGWGIHSAGGANDTAVIYNKKVLDLVKGTTRMISNEKQGKGAFRDRAAAIARLRDKESGREFYQVAAHTIGHAQRGNAGWQSLMNAQYAGIRKLVDDLKGDGIPVFLAGDFNTNSKRSNIPLNFGLEHMAGIGLDRIFASMANAGRMKRIAGSSDHDAILSQLNIPGLAKGAQNIRWDNTLANLHKGEAVLTEDIASKFRKGVNEFASGGGNQYDVKVYVTEPDASADEIADKVITKLERRESRKPTRRSS